MDDGQLSSWGTGLLIGGGSIAGAILMQVLNWFLNRKTTDAQNEAVIADYTAKTNLIEALEARIKSQEDREQLRDGRIKELEERITQEVDLRLKGQEENHKLKLRITQLEYAMKNMGIAVPTWDIMDDK